MSTSCPSCSKIFKFASRLKIHLESTIHCRKTPEEINTFFLKFKKKEGIFKCTVCNNHFSNKGNLKRHLTISTCNIEYEKKEKEKQIQIEQLQKQIDELKNHTTQKQVSKYSQQAHQTHQSQQASAIQIINNNHNERIINNNLTINNTIIQHIYPLGYEKLPNISQQEMIKLLELGDKGVIEIVKLVCEQDENKNFYKINLNKNNISYLSNQYKIDICQETELKKTLLKQCVILTYQMLIVCSPLLSSEKIYEINSNLKKMSDKMKAEIYDNGLKNIIEYELRTNNKITKDKITKYTKEINENTTIKEEAIGKYNTILQLKDTTNKSLTKGISLFEINEKLGDPISIPEMAFEYTYNDFNTKRFEYTTYLNYWNKRMNDEEQYIKLHPKTSLCDVFNFEERKKDINNKIAFMKTQSEDMRRCDNQNKILINKDNFEVLIAHAYINENQRIKS